MKERGGRSEVAGRVPARVPACPHHVNTQRAARRAGRVPPMADGTDAPESDLDQWASLIAVADQSADVKELISLSINTGSSVDAANLQKTLGFLIASVQSLAASAQRAELGLNDANQKMHAMDAKLLEGRPPAGSPPAQNLDGLEASITSTFAPKISDLQREIEFEFAPSEAVSPRPPTAQNDDSVQQGLRMQVESLSARLEETEQKLVSEVAEMRSSMATELESIRQMRSTEPSPAPAPALTGLDEAEFRSLCKVVQGLRDELTALYDHEDAVSQQLLELHIGSPCSRLPVQPSGRGPADLPVQPSASPNAASRGTTPSTPGVVGAQFGAMSEPSQQSTRQNTQQNMQQPQHATQQPQQATQQSTRPLPEAPVHQQQQQSTRQATRPLPEAPVHQEQLASGSSSGSTIRDSDPEPEPEMAPVPEMTPQMGVTAEPEMARAPENAAMPETVASSPGQTNVTNVTNVTIAGREVIGALETQIQDLKQELANTAAAGEQASGEDSHRQEEATAALKVQIEDLYSQLQTARESSKLQSMEPAPLQESLRMASPLVGLADNKRPQSKEIKMTRRNQASTQAVVIGEIKREIRELEAAQNGDSVQFAALHEEQQNMAAVNTKLIGQLTKSFEKLENLCAEQDARIWQQEGHYEDMRLAIANLPANQVAPGGIGKEDILFEIELKVSESERRLQASEEAERYRVKGELDRVEAELANVKLVREELARQALELKDAHDVDSKLEARITNLGRELHEEMDRPPTAPANESALAELRELQGKMDERGLQMNDQVNFRLTSLQKELTELSTTLPGEMTAVNDGLEAIKSKMAGKADSNAIRALQAVIDGLRDTVESKKLPGSPPLSPSMPPRRAHQPPPQITAQILPDMNNIYSALNEMQKSLRSKADLADFASLQQHIEPKLRGLMAKLANAERMQSSISDLKVAHPPSTPNTVTSRHSTPNAATTARGGRAAGWTPSSAVHAEPSYGGSAVGGSGAGWAGESTRGAGHPGMSKVQVAQLRDELAGKADLREVEDLLDKYYLARARDTAASLPSLKELAAHEARVVGRVRRVVQQYTAGATEAMQLQMHALQVQKVDRAEVRRLEKLVGLALGLPAALTGSANSMMGGSGAISDPGNGSARGVTGDSKRLVNMGGGGYAWRASSGWSGASLPDTDVQLEALQAQLEDSLRQLRNTYHRSGWGSQAIIKDKSRLPPGMIIGPGGGPDQGYTDPGRPPSVSFSEFQLPIPASLEQPGGRNWQTGGDRPRTVTGGTVSSPRKAARRSPRPRREPSPALSEPRQPVHRRRPGGPLSPIRTGAAMP